jgi:hypothetical protein
MKEGRKGQMKTTAAIDSYPQSESATVKPLASSQPPSSHQRALINLCLPAYCKNSQTRSKQVKPNFLWDMPKRTHFQVSLSPNVVEFDARSAADLDDQIRVNPTKSHLEMNCFLKSRFPDSPLRSLEPANIPAKSDWPNRPCSTIVWPGFERNKSVENALEKEN